MSGQLIDLPVLTLDLTQSDTPRYTLGNVVEILEKDTHYAGRVQHCEFRGTILIDGEEAEDGFTGELGVDLGARYRMTITSPRTLEWALATVARRHIVHPLRDYLDALVWDQTPRLDTWLSDYCGAQQSPLVAIMGRKWLISAVARVYEPGCQVDTVLVLKGPQGAGKSSVARCLGGAFFRSTGIDVRSKDARIALQGAWIVEWPELDAMKRSESTAIKAFITDTHDAYRPPYGRTTIKRPRQCVIIATTNDARFLNDHTGDRRFWVIDVGLADLPALAEVRDQLLAEAVARHAAGQEWWLTREEEHARDLAAAEHRIEDPWLAAARRWIDAHHPLGGFATETLLTDEGERDRDGSWVSIPGIGVPTGRAGPYDMLRLTHVLEQLGLERRRCRQPDGSRPTLWYPMAPRTEAPSEPPEAGSADPIDW